MKRIGFILLCFLTLLCSSLTADIAIYGDTRSDENTHRKVIAAITAHKPEIAFHTGDLNQKGTLQSEYDSFFQIVKPLTDICPLYPAKGNHEKSRDLFLNNFPALKGSAYYSLVYDGIKFIVLDSTDDLSPGSPQYHWLKRAVADSLPAILIMHHPVFSSGYHGDELGLQLWLPQMLASTNVKAVFCAHDHGYERSEYKGISYIISGGGGAPLREQGNTNPHSLVFSLSYHYIIAKHEAGKLECKVWDIDNKLLDAFTLNGF